MECFIHASNQAVGICKYCSKAICRECARDVKGGLACSEECAIENDELDQMMDRSKKIYGIGIHQTNKPPTGVIVFAVLSLFMWGMVIARYLNVGELRASSLTPAILITGLFLYMRVSSKRTGIKT